MFRILFSVAIIASNLNGYQTKSMNGDFSKTPTDQMMVKMFPLLDHIAKQSKCNMADDLNKTQMAMLIKNEIDAEKLNAIQNQQEDIKKSMGSQLEKQINLEKDQRTLMETFKNIIPEYFSDRLAKMEGDQTSLQETLNKISLDFDKAQSVIHDQQDSVLAQLEVEINLEKDQNTQLKTLTNTLLETSKKIPEDLQGRLDRMEKNQKDKQNKCNIVGELNQTQMAMQKNSAEKLIAIQNQQADIHKSMGLQLETQINLEKDQRSLMETFKNIIPEDFKERLAKMVEHEASLQETLNKISLDFDKAQSVIHDQQDSVLAQLKVEINLEKDQKTQLETLTNTVLETSKKIREDLEGRLDRMEKNQKDKQSKCNIVDDLNKTQMEMQKNNEEKLIAMQNQQADIQKSIQINLEKNQWSLIETFKNTIPENFTERLAKMEKQQTTLQETLKKIPVDFEERLSRMEDYQKAVGTQLETQINLAKDQNFQLEALNKSIPENFEERLIKMEEQQISLEKTSKKIPEAFESRLETIEKNLKDILSKMETQQVIIMDTLKNQILPEQIIALQNQQADITKSMGSQLETQINLEKDQKALMETFKNIIPEHFTERLAKMEEHETTLQDTLNKISLDFNKARNVIHDQQDSVLAQLEVEINLEKDQKTQLETLKKNTENLKGRLDRMEKNQKDMHTKMETQQAALVGTLSKISTKVSWLKFERIGSRYFYINNGSKYTWEGAVSACREIGGYIAAIKDKDELGIIKTKLGDKHYWLGINDRASKGVYKSEASGREDIFIKWKSGEPNHGKPEERCVELANGEMNDDPCSDKKFLICQIDLDV